MNKILTMYNNFLDQLIFLVQEACDLCKCQHLFLRGNYQQEMFYDKVDMINAWNRMWLAAFATGVEIVSAVILNNHLHLNALFKSDEQKTRFKSSFRLSITQYHNKRYELRGTLGTRTFKQGIIKNTDDLKDCICYHIRNVFHHGIQRNYLDYKFSTARLIFDLAAEDQKGVYSGETIPDNLAKAYLPGRTKLPEGWMMTREGMIVPPKGVFRADIVQALFGNKKEYLEHLSQRTIRESADQDESMLVTSACDSNRLLTLDERIIEFVKENCKVPIPSMSPGQKMAAICKAVEEFPRVNMRLLARLFSIPYSTLRYRLKSWHFRK